MTQQRGPYHQGPRMRGLGEWLGRVYRTHNRETGAPALLEVQAGHTPHRAPLASARVLVTAWQGEALAVELQEGPPGALVDVLDCAAELAEYAAGRPEAAAHLSAYGPRAATARKPRQSRRARRWGHLVALAAGTALALWPRAVRQPVTWEEAPTVTPAVVLTAGVEFSSTPGKAWRLPSKPYEGQRRPPCDPVLEREFNGGCWVSVNPNPGTTPPGQACPAGVFEKDGKCYMPAGKAKGLPNTVKE